jgi:hypothetical protein
MCGEGWCTEPAGEVSHWQQLLLLLLLLSTRLSLPVDTAAGSGRTKHVC